MSPTGFLNENDLSRSRMEKKETEVPLRNITKNKTMTLTYSLNRSSHSKRLGRAQLTFRYNYLAT